MCVLLHKYCLAFSLSLKSPLRTQQHLCVFYIHVYMYDVNTLYIQMYMYMTNTHCKYHHTWFKEGTRRGPYLWDFWTERVTLWRRNSSNILCIGNMYFLNVYAVCSVSQEVPFLKIKSVEYGKVHKKLTNFSYKLGAHIWTASCIVQSGQIGTQWSEAAGVPVVIVH